jgi:anti-sigma regulatory factor (Ser/Thr protein kinase)
MDSRAAAWHFESPDAKAACGQRKAFASHLEAHGTGDSDIASSEIIFGELIGNVLRHAPGPIWVHVDWTTDRRARLTIRDSGPPFALRTILPKDHVENGRGLYIVAQLARELSVTRATNPPPGSVVTAILPVVAV